MQETRRISWGFRLLCLFLLLPFLRGSSTPYCDALRRAATDGDDDNDVRSTTAVPRFLAVISSHSSDGANISWAADMPIPYVVYSQRLNGAEAASYLSFIVDHYHCLPRHLLFLHGSAFHPLSPPRSSALVDVETVDKGFLALGHLSSAPGAEAVLHAAAAGFSASAPFSSHRAAFVAQEQGSTGCECKNK